MKPEHRTHSTTVHDIFAERLVIFNLVVVSRHALATPTKPELKNTLRAVGEVTEECVTETAKCVVPSLLEADFRKSGVEMAAENVGLVQLLTAAGAEQKSRLAVAEELNQQLRHVSREVYLSLPIFRLEVIVNLTVPCLLIDDDAGTAVENLLDAYTQRLTNSETTRTAKYEKHTHLRLDGYRVGKVAHDFNCESLPALFLLDDLWDDQAHLFPITWVDFLAVLINAGRKDHLHDLEVILDRFR